MNQTISDTLFQFSTHRAARRGGDMPADPTELPEPECYSDLRSDLIIQTTIYPVGHFPRCSYINYTAEIKTERQSVRIPNFTKNV
jgi:hypothetical protein